MTAVSLGLPASERFEVGRVASLTVRMIGRHLPMFLMLTVLCVLVPAVVSGAVAIKTGAGSLNGANLFTDTARGRFTPPPAGAFWSRASTWLISSLMALYLQAVVTETIVADLSGRSATSLTGLVRNVPALLAIVILVALATGAGLILLVVPGVVVGLALCLASPVQVAEGAGVFRSISRSWALTRGCRWKMFLVLLVYFVAVMGLGIVLGLAKAALHISPATWGIAFAPVTTAVTTLLRMSGLAVMYAELRGAKYGAPEARLAAAFA